MYISDAGLSEYALLQWKVAQHMLDSKQVLQCISRQRCIEAFSPYVWGSAT